MYRKLLIAVMILFSISSLYPQSDLKELSRLKINFANGTNIKELYRQDNLLFALTEKLYENYVVSLYDISFLSDPREIGRWDKNSFSGDTRYQKYISYVKDTLIPFPFYAVRKDTSSEDFVHYFWKPNAIVNISDIYVSVRETGQVVKAFRINKSPWKTELIGSIRLNSLQSAITGSAVINNVIYIAERYFGANTGLMMIDASNPAEMKEIQSPLKGQDLTGLAAGKNKMIIGKDFKEFLVYDCSDPFNPKYLKTVSYSHQKLSGFWQNNRYYIFSEKQDLAIFDNDLNLLNKIPSAGDIYSAGLYSADLMLGSSAGLEIYNINNPNNPVTETVYGANVAQAKRFVKQGRYLYTVNLGDGLKIIDVSDSTKPVISGILSIKGYTRDIAVSDRYAFLADFTKGLIIADITDPANPKLLSTLSIPTASGVDIQEDKAFIVTNNNELFVVNIVDKQKPEIEYSKVISTPRYADGGLELGRFRHIRAAGNNLWMTFYEDSLYAFQYSDKTLTRTFSYKSRFAGSPDELKVKDSLLFVSDINALIFDTYKLSLIGQTDSSVFSQIISTAYDKYSKILYTMIVVDWGAGIGMYDLADPSHPKRLKGGIDLDYPRVEILADKGLLYLLNTDEVIIYSTDKPLGIDDNNSNRRNSILSYKLDQNYPNPFNPETTISYSIGGNNNVSLKLYDILGNEIAIIVNEYKTAGTHTAHFDASSLPSGIYIYTLQSGEYRASRKLILLK